MKTADKSFTCAVLSYQFNLEEKWQIRFWLRQAR